MFASVAGAALSRHLELEAERTHHLQHGGKFRVSIRRERLVQALAPEAGGPSDLRHSLGTGDHAQRMGDQRRIASSKTASR